MILHPPQISDADGELKMETVAEGEIQKEMLDPNDVFLVDLGVHLYVWVGDGKQGYCLSFVLVVPFLDISRLYSAGMDDIAAGMDDIAAGMDEMFTCNF